jgi:hypothetical protein
MPWNTTVAPVDSERIRRALVIPAEKQWMDLIRAAQARIERDSPDAIATIQELLDNRYQAYGDAGYALIKADVLEWEPGVKPAGLDTLQEEWKRELSEALLIEPPDRGYGTLSRS